MDTTRKEYHRQYRLKNKEKIKKIQERWKEKHYEKNKVKINEQKKKWRDSHKDDLNRVYLLEDYNYVGVTNNVYHRFTQHKSKHNRDCTNYRILYKSKSREDCLELEDLLHDMGYNGRHKQNTYK